MYDDLFSTVTLNKESKEVAKLWENLLTLPNNCLQVLLDENDDPYLENHWLTDVKLQVKKQIILSQTQPIQMRDQLNTSGCPSQMRDQLNTSGCPSQTKEQLKSSGHFSPSATHQKKELNFSDIFPPLLIDEPVN